MSRIVFYKIVLQKFMRLFLKYRGKRRNWEKVFGVMNYRLELTADSVFGFIGSALGFDHTTTGAFSAKGRIDDGCGTAYPRLNAYRPCRAVHCAGATLHATVPFFNVYPAVIHAENSMGTNHHTHPASRAFFLVQLKCDNIF
jgi:hypothetical protein